MSYFPQDHPDFNGLRHLMLLYGNATRPWTTDDLKFYAAHFDAQGRPDDWLFDSFLFLNLKSSSGRDYCADINTGTTMSGEGDFAAKCSPQPAEITDWKELLEFYFGPGGSLAQLNAAIADLSSSIRSSYGRKRNVVLMLPYPHITQPSFGSTKGGASLDFSVEKQNLHNATEQRLAAEQWMVNEIVRRWDPVRYPHLHLLGVYWMFETMYRSWEIDDHWLLKELRRHVNARGLKFLWIPFWSTYNVHLLDNYQQYYFDLAFLQPNYMFYRSGKTIEAASKAASARSAGIEIEYYLELNEPIAIQDQRHGRFREYLNGGVTNGYMTESVCAHFHGVGSLARMHGHPDSIEREFYQDIYHFVKGSYVVKPSFQAENNSPVSEDVVLAADLGGTNVRAAIVGKGGRILERMSITTPQRREEILAGLVRMLKALKDLAEKQNLSVKGVGISTGGRVDHKSGVVVDATALLRGWSNVDLRTEIERRLALPVVVDNDGNCAAAAELAYGEGRGKRNFLSVVLGTGIGGGIVLDGKLMRGVASAAAEFGHISVQSDGRPCTCGSRGCVEQYASGSGIESMAKERAEAGMLPWNGSDPLTAESVGELARSGNENALSLLEEAGKKLGLALAGLANTLDPERIILSGRVLHIGSGFVDEIRTSFQGNALIPQRNHTEIVVSTLQDGGLKGAAWLMFEHLGLP